MDISKVSLCLKSDVITLCSILKTIKTCFWIKIHENLSLVGKYIKLYIPSGSGVASFQCFTFPSSTKPLVIITVKEDQNALTTEYSSLTTNVGIMYW